MSRYIWLSYPLAIDGPRPPAIPAPELTDLYTVARDGAGVQILRVANHTGTHVDSPCHVVEGGVPITDFRPEELIFTRPLLVDLHLPDAAVVMPADLEPHAERLQQADLALFRFGYGEVRRRDPQRFSTRCPGFGIESARWLRQTCPRLRAMGLDVPSVAVIACLERHDGGPQRIALRRRPAFPHHRGNGPRRRPRRAGRGPHPSLAGARDGQRAVFDRGGVGET